MQKELIDKEKKSQKNPKFSTKDERPKRIDNFHI